MSRASKMKMMLTVSSSALAVALGIWAGLPVQAEPLPAPEPPAVGEGPVEVVPEARPSLQAPAAASEPASPVIESPGTEASSAYYPRDPEEWQGMLVSTAVKVGCGGPDPFCGMAQACIDSVCQACTEDSQCRTGEACVLDHCVLEENVTCRLRADCGVDELCVLSGYSAGPRGNEEMTASCLSEFGGKPEAPADAHQPEIVRIEDHGVSPVALEALLDEALSK